MYKSPFISTKLQKNTLPARNCRGNVVVVCASSSPVQIPQSRSEAVDQALVCVEAQLKTSKKNKKSKSFGSGSTNTLSRMLVELPLNDESPKTIAELGMEFASKMSALDMGTLTFIYFSKEAAQIAAADPNKPKNVVVASLDSARGQSLTGALVLVCPGQSQVRDVANLVANWLGTVCVGVNAALDPETAPADQRAFARTFTVVYSFLPLAIQFFLSKKEGVVFKYGQEPWRVYYQEGNGLRQIAQQANRRPNADDLELAFLNASAADSPLTKAAKGIRGALDKIQKKK